LAFTAFAVTLLVNPTKSVTLRTYLFSLAYLALLFIAMAIDAVA
jgi:heme O synthase-like polyprenyltransferase